MDEMALTKKEIEILDQAAAEAKPPTKKATGFQSPVVLARLRGYQALASNPPPGNIVV